ncbi:transcriptional regulator [Moritella sp. Urea-trap-13]|uniref:winged helix-turn-helix domain-containing protein n=1 Tax=Moritella sp. Urea-trap-13 TaxID=2058327 RepID=UPI0012FEBC80|nr:helix-turn-helix domain-containing protein [Moritella sp. Urea-trap-13]
MGIAVIGVLYELFRIVLEFRLTYKSVILNVFNTPYRLNITEQSGDNASLIECSLTAIEGELFFLLLKERQATRERCESVLWKGRIISDSSRSLTQVVSTLRKKLRLFGIDNLIFTQPRLGYVLTKECKIIDLTKPLNIDDKTQVKINVNQVDEAKSEAIKSKFINKQNSNLFFIKITKCVAKYSIVNPRLLISLCVFIISFVITAFIVFHSYDHMHTNISTRIKSIYHDENNMLEKSNEFTIEDSMMGFDNNRMFLWDKTADGWTGIITTRIQCDRNDEREA